MLSTLGRKAGALLFLSEFAKVHVTTLLFFFLGILISRNQIVSLDFSALASQPAEGLPKPHIYGVGAVVWRNFVCEHLPQQSVFFFGEQHSRKMAMSQQLVDFLVLQGLDADDDRRTVEYRLRSVDTLCSNFLTTVDPQTGVETERCGTSTMLHFDQHGILKTKSFATFSLDATFAIGGSSPRFKILESLTSRFEMQRTTTALKALRFTEDDIADMTKILFIIAKLESVEFVESDDCAEVVENVAVEEIADLLGIEEEVLIAALTTSSIEVILIFS